MEWAAGLFLTLFLAILLCCGLQLQIYRASSLYLEDALAASNLASALIDLEEYGISHTLQIENPMEAYAVYREALKENLGLDNNWECANRGLISGKVTVESYIIYNVKGTTVKIYDIGADGRMQEGMGYLGTLAAPNGVMIESTGVYSEISFPAESFLGSVVEAHKGKLVDVVMNE